LEDALERLDKSTQEVVRMAFAQVLKATLAVDEKIRRVDEVIHRVDDSERVVLINGTQIVFTC